MKLWVKCFILFNLDLELDTNNKFKKIHAAALKVLLDNSHEFLNYLNNDGELVKFEINLEQFVI